MLCTRCKKRQAVVFVQRLENGKPVQEGYCLTCARELHIQPVDDLMKRFNMTDDQLASMEEHMADLMQQAQESGAMMPMMVPRAKAKSVAMPTRPTVQTRARARSSVTGSGKYLMERPRSPVSTLLR